MSNLLYSTLPYTYAGVSLWDDDVRKLRRHVVAGAPPSDALLAGDLVDEGFPAAIAYARGRTMVFRESDPNGIAPHALRTIVESGFRSGAGIPLETARARVGVLTVAVPDDRAWSMEELELLEQVSRQFAIAIENARAYQEISDLKERLAEEKLYLEDELEGRGDFKGIIGSSQALTSVLHAVRTVAPTDATVLLLGETGTGKEVVARAIHDTSRRQRQTFVRVNAAALPSALVESELFGYEKGAFTGAVAAKVGRLELAHRGTCSSTRLATCRSISSRSCCERCRSTSSNGSAAPGPSASTFASSRRRIAIWRRWSRPVPSAATCTPAQCLSDPVAAAQGTT